MMWLKLRDELLMKYQNLELIRQNFKELFATVFTVQIMQYVWRAGEIGLLVVAFRETPCWVAYLEAKNLDILEEKLECLIAAIARLRGPGPGRETLMGLVSSLVLCLHKRGYIMVLQIRNK